MTAAYEGWVVLELMGHRTIAGQLSEAQVGSTTLLRIDMPGDGDEPVATQFYAPSAVYCITPTTEDVARKVAAHRRGDAIPAAVRLALPTPDDDEFDHDEDDDEGPW